MIVWHPARRFALTSNSIKSPNSVRKPAALPMRPVTDASSYFHTDKFLQQHHFSNPPRNYFAYWS
ncbi:MAG: hypothetical protein ACXWXT_05535, partial [Candidatus Binatia bacterium]